MGHEADRVTRLLDEATLGWVGWGNRMGTVLYAIVYATI